MNFTQLNPILTLKNKFFKSQFKLPKEEKFHWTLKESQSLNGKVSRKSWKKFENSRARCRKSFCSSVIGCPMTHAADSWLSVLTKPTFQATFGKERTWSSPGLHSRKVFNFYLLASKVKSGAILTFVLFCTNCTILHDFLQALAMIAWWLKELSDSQ